MTLTWPMPLPTPPAPGVIEAGSALAPDSPVDVGVPLYYTQDDFLDPDFLDQVLPSWYLDPLRSNGQGYELLQAYAKMFEAVSLAVGNFQTLATLAYSSGGACAYASVEFYRESLTSGSFTVKAGTIVKTS